MGGLYQGQLALSSHQSSPDGTPFTVLHSLTLSHSVVSYALQLTYINAYFCEPFLTPLYFPLSIHELSLHCIDIIMMAAFPCIIIIRVIVIIVTLLIFTFFLIDFRILEITIYVVVIFVFLFSNLVQSIVKAISEYC